MGTDRYGAVDECDCDACERQRQKKYPEVVAALAARVKELSEPRDESIDVELLRDLEAAGQTLAATPAEAIIKAAGEEQ